VQIWYAIEVGPRQPQQPERERRRRGLLAWITGDPGVRSVEDDLTRPAPRPALTPTEALVRGFELFAQSGRVTEVEIREPQLGSFHRWSLTVDDADEMLDGFGLELTADEFYDGKTVPLQLGTALLRATLAPEGDLYLSCGLSAPGLLVWPERGDMLMVGVDDPHAETVAMVEQLGLTIQPGQDPWDAMDRLVAEPADDAFWTEVADRTDRAGVPLPCGQRWILGVDQWFLVDRANLAQVRAQIKPRALVMLLDKPLVAPDRELIERYRQQLRDALQTWQQHWQFLIRDAQDQHIRSIRPGELFDLEVWEATIEGCDLIGAYWCEFEPVPKDGLIAVRPDPDGIVRAPWMWMSHT
jgi:hypothetical protein